MIKTVMLGAGILFGVPILLGIGLAAWFDTVVGMVGGVLLFFVITAVAFRYMRKGQGN